MKTVEPQGSGGSNPPCSGEKIGEILWRGFETRSQPPTGGERDRRRPRRGALVRAIPPAPMGIKEKSFGVDSKRGPADPGEEKGTEGGPGGANPPAPIRIKEKSFGGDSKRGPADPTGGRRDRGRPRKFWSYM